MYLHLVFTSARECKVRGWSLSNVSVHMIAEEYDIGSVNWYFENTNPYRYSRVSVHFEMAIKTVTVCVSPQSRPMSGMDLLGWLVGQGWGGEGTRAEDMPSFLQPAGRYTLWVAEFSNLNTDTAILDLTLI